jgi:hypothetical protein
MKRGDLPQSADWYQWEFSTPPKLTIDDGRITKELEALWKMGAANLRDIVSMRGKTLEAHYTERAQEVWLRKHYAHSVADALNATHGMKHTVSDREMAMLTPNEMAEQTPSPSVDNDENHDDGNDERVRFENLKSKFDAYGVAVRAGAITPAEMDEETFRKEAGLPNMSPAVRGAWKEDKGYRRPITLAPPGGAKSRFGAPPQRDTSTDGDQP